MSDIRLNIPFTLTSSMNKPCIGCRLIWRGEFSTGKMPRLRLIKRSDGCRNKDRDYCWLFPTDTIEHDNNISQHKLGSFYE